MKPIQTYNVRPNLPERVERLLEIAMRLWYEWDYDALSLFLRMDRDLWEATSHNPVKMLGSISQERLLSLARDDGFLAQYDRVCKNLDEYLNAQTWFESHKPASNDCCYAYFAFEFGLSECLPLYSGGLGVLSGDMIKTASDLGLPLVGVGVLFQQGYFRQYLNRDGWQGERYPDNDFFNMPVRLERRPDGQPLTIKIEYPTGVVHAQVWRVEVGRTPLVMLDTNIPQNARAEDRAIGQQLYGGDIENRIRQEILLGVGGLRALEALGMRPNVCHLNEGHSAFLTVERIARRMERDGLAFDEALEATRVGNVFTTHTPVPAGNEVFPSHTIERYLRSLYGQSLPVEDILRLGRQNPNNASEGFGMTVFAIRMSGRVNGVSQLHARVAREMWNGLWPRTLVEETPIEAITNGVHMPSWVSHNMAEVIERYVDAQWRERGASLEMWRRIEEIPSEELWRTHELRRERLVSFARRHLRQALEARRASAEELARADEALDTSALTIVFARRMATYKRGALLLRDMDRLRALINNAERPVQFIFAGKAHPHDTPGKEVIREITHVASMPEFCRHFVFLEDYDMHVARYLVQGADVWLNTPRRPLEASGTSGMKAAANGVLNLSILDGWFDEAHQVHPEIGWAIGGEVYGDHAYQDKVESAALYNVLEQEVTPLFYRRGLDNTPREWVGRMKIAMRVSASIFNTDRMARQYARRLYFPAAVKHAEFAADGSRRARDLAAWKKRVRKQWGAIRIESVVSDLSREMNVGAAFNVRARIRLGELTPDEIRVEAIQGEVDPSNEIQNFARVEMECQGAARESGKETDGVYMFIARIETRASGLFGFSVRVLPRHKDLVTPFMPGLIVWANE